MENNPESENIMNNSIDINNLIDDGRNKFAVSCIRCPSRILNATAAEFKEIEFALPTMTSRRNQNKDCIDDEKLNQYWMVKDKFTFENIGFCNMVSGVKYLICADCEIGPIGWFDPASQFCYVSVSRVKNQS